MAAVSCGIDAVKGKAMKQIRVSTMVVALLLAAGGFAQSGQSHHDSMHQGSGQGVGQGHGHGAAEGIPTAEEQLKALTGKLDLTGDQQARVKPILQELHDATQKLMQDKSMSQEQRLAKVRPQRAEADKKIRDILNDGQKKKLDAYESGPHPEMHGDLHGPTPPPARPPQL
jgi:hypothetical protein